MNADIERIREYVDSIEGAKTAHEISVELKMNSHKVSTILFNQARQARVGRMETEEGIMYYSLKNELKSVRRIVAEETQRKHREYVKNKSKGARNYSIAHMDMLRILASQGNEKAKNEIQRRQEVSARTK